MVSLLFHIRTFQTSWICMSVTFIFSFSVMVPEDLEEEPPHRQKVCVEISDKVESRAVFVCLFFFLIVPWMCPVSSRFRHLLWDYRGQRVDGLKRWVAHSPFIWRVCSTQRRGTHHCNISVTVGKKSWDWDKRTELMLAWNTFMLYSSW